MRKANGLYKTECTRTKVFHDGACKVLSDVECATAGWVQWYNTHRLHSTLDYLTPVEFETARYTSFILEGHPV